MDHINVKNNFSAHKFNEVSNLFKKNNPETSTEKRSTANRERTNAGILSREFNFSLQMSVATYSAF